MNTILSTKTTRNLSPSLRPKSVRVAPESDEPRDSISINWNNPALKYTGAVVASSTAGIALSVGVGLLTRQAGATPQLASLLGSAVGGVTSAVVAARMLA